MVIFDPLDKFYKSETGAVKENTLVKFRLRCFCDRAVLVFYNDNGFNQRVEMNKEDCFTSDVKLPVGLYWYYFDLCNGTFVGKGENYYGIITDDPKSFQFSVYDEDFVTPKWLQGGIIYQIFPDRFCRKEEFKDIPDYKVLHNSWQEFPVYTPNERGEVLNNDFFGGDIKGIISKLDYLKELNVTAIYLNPIFEAYSNHRYDTGDYFKIDKLLGNEEDLQNLISEGQKRNIKIILDGVFNHTGSDSIYFNKENRYQSLGAYQSKDSKYYSWYDFTEYPNKYASWWGIKTLPATNKNNDGFLNFIAGEGGVIEHYTKLGIGGFRLDVVDELPERFSEKIRSAIKSVNKDAVVIGEVWEDASNKISYGKRRKYFLGKELDSVMNYPLKNAIISYCKKGDESELVNVIKTQIDHYPKQCLNILMNILSTHDTARLLSALSDIDVSGKKKEEMPLYLSNGEYQKAVERLKIAVVLQYTLYGVPSVYYGDEVGMQGFIDPLNRQTFPWGYEDENILSFYRCLGKIRVNDVFTGDIELLYFENGVIAYKRVKDNDEVIVAVSLSKDVYDLKFEGRVKNLIDGKVYKDSVELKKGDCLILINAE